MMFLPWHLFPLLLYKWTDRLPQRPELQNIELENKIPNLIELWLSENPPLQIKKYRLWLKPKKLGTTKSCFGTAKRNEIAIAHNNGQMSIENQSWKFCFFKTWWVSSVALISWNNLCPQKLQYFSPQLLCSFTSHF